MKAPGVLAAACLAPAAWAQPAPEVPAAVRARYPATQYETRIEHHRFRGLDVVLLRARLTSADAGAGAFRFPCEAWIGVQKGGRWTARRTVKMEGVGGYEGMFLPRQQPSADFFLLVSFGNYDGRLWKVLPDGRVVDCEGGNYLRWPEAGFLLSRYDSDACKLSVTELRTGATRAVLDLPGELLEVRRKGRALFLVVIDESRPDAPNGVYELAASGTRLLRRSGDMIRGADKVDWEFTPEERP